jgi:hypothetical protein
MKKQRKQNVTRKQPRFAASFRISLAHYFQEHGSSTLDGLVLSPNGVVTGKDRLVRIMGSAARAFSTYTQA